jgi:hypothetical protein
MEKAHEVLALAQFLDDLARVHEQEFPDFENPARWTEETSQLFKAFVEKELTRGIPFLSRSRRAAAKAAAASDAESRMREMTAAAKELERNLPEAVLASLQVAFEDNKTRAVPIECVGDCAKVALVVRDVDGLLGNRRPDVTKSGNPSLATWPKRDRNDYYLRVILSDVVATAKEGFANAPGIQSMSIVVIRQTDTGVGSQRRMDAVMHLQIDRAAVTNVDWSTTAPMDALGSAQIEINRRKSTGALESLARAHHPDVAKALDALQHAS